MKRRMITLCLVLLLLAVSNMAFAADTDIVSIPDAAFKSFLNGKLGHAAAADITQADMKRITQIELPRSVADLEGIQYCTNLTWFRTYGTPKNLQLLGNCKKIGFLAIMSSMLDDIGFVSGLTEIYYLDLYNDEIQDITPLKNLTKLKVLDLMGNHVIDMSPLKNLHAQMTHLYGLSESRTLSLDCVREENGYCIIKNPVVGIDAKPVAPQSVSNCEYDAATNTFRVPAGTSVFSFGTSQPTIPGSTDFQNYFNTRVTVNINHPPKTGDNSHIALLFAFLAVSGCTLLLNGFGRKKKKAD